MSVVARKIVLHFPQRMVDRPIVSRLVREYGLDFNILKASINPDKEGMLVMELTGEHDNYNKGIKYLTEVGVRIQSLSQDVSRNEDRCTNCGACITICPAKAFEVEAATRRILFYNDKCLACGVCIKACPPRAMELHF